MKEVKGTAVVHVRKEIEARGREAVQAMLQQLSPEAQKHFRTILPISFTSKEIMAEILEKAVQILHPGDQNGLRKLGQSMAVNHLSGIYHLLFKVVSVSFLVKQAATIWSTYHTAGLGHGEINEQEKKATIIVEKYPDMPASFREFVCGYLKGGIELTSAKNVQVGVDASNPDAWRWNANWE